MKTLAIAIAIATTTALTFGAFAQTQPQSSPAQAAPSGSTAAPAAAPAARSDSPAAARSDSKAATRSGGGVNIRANIRTGSDRSVIRSRDRGPSVVYSRSRTRYISTVDDRPSRVTVIKKNKKYTKKKRTRIYATAPSRSTTIIERRRPRNVVIEGGVSRSRVISRDSGVRARIGVSTTTRSTTGSSNRSTTGSSGRSSGETGAGSAGTTAPSTSGSGATGASAPANAPASNR